MNWALYETRSTQNTSIYMYMYIICWLIINKPQPNFHSGDASIQGTLALVPRVSPQ